MTLEQVHEAVQPAVALKERERLLRNEIAAVRAQLGKSDRRLFDLIQRVVPGVKADIDEGDDGKLYDAMD